VLDGKSRAGARFMAWCLDCSVLLENLGLGTREQAIETPQYSKWKDHFTVLVAFVRTPEQITDAPDEASEL